MIKVINSLSLYIYIGSKAICSSARFTLADLDTTMSKGQLTVKKEKCSSPLTPERSTIDLIGKTLGSRKRKTMDFAGLSLESLRAKEALQKLVSFSQAVSVGFILVLFFILPFDDPL